MLPDVTIVIPSFNGLHLLKSCLHSVENQTYCSVETVVVDNGSKDGTAEWICRHHPEIRVIRLHSNKGFGAAVNAGIRSAESCYIFLLNNDTEMDADCLSILLQSADANEGYASFAPKMLQYFDRDRLDGAGDGMFRGGAGYRMGTGEPDGPLWDDSRPVFGACAGAALYRRSFFENVGLFDEDFFAYLEDVDINVRALRLGFRCLYVPTAKIYHMGSRTTGSRLNPLTVSRTTQNMFRVVIQNYPASLLIRHWPDILMQQIGWSVLMLWRGHLVAYLRGIGSALRFLPPMLKKRKRWKGRKTVSDKWFWERIVRSEKEIMRSLLRRRLFDGRFDGLIRCYMRIFIDTASRAFPEKIRW